MTGLIRIVSDLHYGDRATRLRSLSQLNPILDGVDELVLNGDTLDTRQGHYPQRTAQARAEVETYFATCAPVVTHLTGNHDPDISPHHTLDLAGGQVFVTHGDIIFDEVVPWGRDAPYFRARIATGLDALDPHTRRQLAPRLAVYRAACLALPQRHQAEPNPFKYALHLAADTVWPPLRSYRILRAWLDTPKLAAAVTAAHRPAARFMLMGHTHRPGVWTTPAGDTVINTGSLCRPFGACAVDITRGSLMVRQVELRSGEFRFGETIAQFALADSAPSPKLPA